MALFLTWKSASLLANASRNLTCRMIKNEDIQPHCTCPMPHQLPFYLPPASITVIALAVLNARTFYVGFPSPQLIAMGSVSRFKMASLPVSKQFLLTPGVQKKVPWRVSVTDSHRHYIRKADRLKSVFPILSHPRHELSIDACDP
jgi:hypothetical protein